MSPPGVPPCPPWAPRGAARRVPGALDEVPGAPFGSGGPARTFSGALLPPRGGRRQISGDPGGAHFRALFRRKIIKNHCKYVYVG